MDENFKIENAKIGDIEMLRIVDSRIRHDYQLEAFLERSIANDSCYLIMADREIAGYAVFDYTFYEQGFVWDLYVALDYRRKGYGLAMMKYFESICGTSKLFTSTNLSNLPMQALLAKLGYKLSGVIHDLDEGDPELVYAKILREGGPRRFFKMNQSDFHE